MHQHNILYIELKELSKRKIDIGAYTSFNFIGIVTATTTQPYKHCE